MGASTPVPVPGGDDLLVVRNLEVVYGDVVLVLRGVSLAVPRGGVVALLGGNGAGKTTLLRAVAGLLDVHRGEITKGGVWLAGKEVTGLGAAQVVRRGLGQVMEGRRIFVPLTVEENLRAATFARRDGRRFRSELDRVYTTFPRLAERRGAVAGYLSGGEQQMLAIGRALMTSPRLLLLDEPSLGLAPTMVEQIAGVISEIHRQGTTVMLIEQNAAIALELADFGYVLEHGRIVKEGGSEQLRGDRDVQEFYLGVGEVGRRSFRDVKTYRRKKRWST